MATKLSQMTTGKKMFIWALLYTGLLIILFPVMVIYHSIFIVLWPVLFIMCGWNMSMATRAMYLEYIIEKKKQIIHDQDVLLSTLNTSLKRKNK